MVLSAVRWQLVPAKLAKEKEPVDVTQILRAPDTRGGPALGAVAVLRNNGDKPAVGVLVRYAVSAKIAPVSGGEASGTWGVPFWSEEERVPQLVPGKDKNVFVRNLNLEPYLRKLFSEGFWPTALRVQVMAEPRRGDDVTHLIAETELPVLWGAAKP